LTDRERAFDTPTEVKMEYQGTELACATAWHNTKGEAVLAFSGVSAHDSDVK